MSIAPIIEDHSFLAEELLIPNANKTDGSRMNMVCSQFSQLLVMNHAEPPLVFSNFENQIASISSGLVTVKENAEVVAVLPYNDCRALVLLKYDTGVLDLVEYKFATNLTESFGYTSESMIEDIGQKFKKGDTLFYNGMYDEHRNFQYGNNLRTVYLPFKGKTYEDAIVISESAAKLLSHTTVTQYLVVLNRNDVCVYDVPKVGEEIKDGVLTARRRISNQTILDSFKNDEFGVLRPGDTPFFGNGIITDVEVMCNTPEDLEFPYNAYFKEVYENQNALYENLLETLNSKKLSKLKLSDNALFWKRKAEDILDPEIKFEYDKREFEGIVVRVDVVEEHECEIGSKLTGRYGNKG